MPGMRNGMAKKKAKPVKKMRGGGMYGRQAYGDEAKGWRGPDAERPSLHA